MLKKISKIENANKISKDSQSKINGGFGLVIGCYGNDQQSCNPRSGCQWYGCYCGPNYPHIAPC